MSELLKKYDSIDQSKLNEATVKILNRVKSITSDFTTEDDKNNKIAEQVLNEVMKKNPDAIKIIKREPKTAPKKAHKATHTAKTKKSSAPTAKKSENNIMSVAKEIQKAGESWKDAMERAKQVLKERKEKVVEKQKTELQKLYALVKTKKELKGFANSDISRDSVRDAKPRGARFVTKEGFTSNQYKKNVPNKLGRKYWETRDRHADRLAPNYPKDMPLLENGGSVEEVYFFQCDSKEIRDDIFEDLQYYMPDHSKKKLGDLYIQIFADKNDNVNLKKIANTTDGVELVQEQFADGGAFGAGYFENGAYLTDPNFGNFQNGVYADGGEIKSVVDALFEFNEKRGKLNTSFGAKTKEGVTALIENDNYSSEEIAKAIFYSNNKKEKISTGYGDKSFFGLQDMIERARGKEYKKGGAVSNERMFNFLKDDLEKLEIAINDGDKEEVERFFSYWLGSSGHLKSLENKGFTENYSRMYNFLKDDLNELENAINDGNTEEVERFFSYWLGESGHLKTLKMANGGSLPFMTDPNFGNFQNTGMFEDGGATDREDFYSKNPRIPRRIEITKKQYLSNKSSIKNNKWNRNLVDPIGYEDEKGVQWVEFDIEVDEKSSWDMYSWINKNIPSSEIKIFVQDKNFNKYEIGGSLPFMTDPNFGNFQNTGMFEDGGLVVKNNQDLEEVAKYMFNAVKKRKWDLKDLIYYFEKENNFDYKYRVKIWDEMNGYEMRKTYENILEMLKRIVEANGKKFELGGAFMMTDLAGHTGGSDGIGNQMPLSGVSGTYYTGLVGETGAMSSGEMFEAGGAMMQNQQVIDDASQSYVNYYINEGASQGMYKKGGAIPNNYKGRTPEDIWNNLTIEQRAHFLHDHNNLIVHYVSTDPKVKSGTLISDLYSPFKSKSLNYSKLNKYAKQVFENHIETGQYASGGYLGKSLYVAYSSYFDSKKYDTDKIISALQSVGAKNIHLENESGMSNQPEVVVFNGNKNQATDALNEAFDTDYILVYEKDWRKPRASYENGGAFGAGHFAEGGFVGTVEFNAGDVVWQKDEKRYATVMNNYGDPVNGDFGDIRLDTTGNTSIFTYDKKFDKTGYNLVKVGEKGDTGKFTPDVLVDMKKSANRLIDSRKESKDKEGVAYYQEVYKRLLDGEFDSMTGAKATASKKSASSIATYVPNRDVKELSVVVKGELRQLKGSDILDGVYVKNSAQSKPKVDANAVFAKILKDAKEVKQGKSKRFDASDLKKINLEMVQKLAEAGYSEQQIRNVILGYAFDNEILADNELEYQYGVFSYEESYIKQKIDALVEAQKNKEFVAGIEYPNFDWQGIIKKYKISSNPKDVVVKKTMGDGSRYDYYYEVFVGENIVLGHNYGYKTFDKNGKLKDDYTEKGKKVIDPTKINSWQKEREYKSGFNGGYWYVVSSKIETIDNVLKTLLSQKDGYCKELELYSDSFAKTLKENNVEFADGGFFDSNEGFMRADNNRNFRYPEKEVYVETIDEPIDLMDYDDQTNDVEIVNINEDIDLTDDNRIRAKLTQPSRGTYENSLKINPSAFEFMGNIPMPSSNKHKND